MESRSRVAAVTVDAGPDRGDDSQRRVQGAGAGPDALGQLHVRRHFRAGTIDVFDKTFAPVKPSGGFVDRRLPHGFAPFNIQNIGDRLYVTYAKQDAAKKDDVPGRWRGLVDVFDTSGNLIRRLATGGPLNAPWTVVQAPANFGQFSYALLVGNFGDGRISAFDPRNGRFLGQLHDASRHGILTIPGLWGLVVGNGTNGGDANTLYFAAGPDEEQHGLFGSIRVATS